MCKKHADTYLATRPFQGILDACAAQSDVDERAKMSAAERHIGKAAKDLPFTQSGTFHYVELAIGSLREKTGLNQQEWEAAHGGKNDKIVVAPKPSNKVGIA